MLGEDGHVRGVQIYNICSLLVDYITRNIYSSILLNKSFYHLSIGLKDFDNLLFSGM